MRRSFLDVAGAGEGSGWSAFRRPKLFYAASDLEAVNGYVMRSCRLGRPMLDRCT